MNWLPIKHTLFVNRTSSGSFLLQIRPFTPRARNAFEATAEEASFHEALSHIENKVKAIRVKRGEG